MKNNYLQYFGDCRDGRVAQLENVYIRGSKIRFLILPDMLKNAPMFKRQGAKAASSGPASGRGKSAILRAQGKHLCFEKKISPPLILIVMFLCVACLYYNMMI